MMQTALGDYDLIRQLGTGNMGIVWVATRRETGQQVALKVVKGGDTDEDRERIEIEKAGAEMQQEIAKKDRRVVAVNRLLRYGGDLLIEMELVSGGDLSTVISAKQIAPNRAARIAMEVCRMLHDLGDIVHGDLKPRNILLHADTVVKVIDFGIAQRVTQPGGKFNPFQSIPYSSPERLKTGMVSRRSDLWSVGVMLYEMVFGVHPFGAGATGIKARVMSGQGPDAFPSFPECPHALKKIILKALANFPTSRYSDANGDADARAMAEDLRRFIAGETVEAAGADPGGTRRTTPFPNPGETVRTGRPQAQPVNPGPKAYVPPAPAAEPASWIRWTTLGLGTAAILFFASWLYGDYRAWNVDSELKRGLETDRVDPDTAWNQVDDSRGSRSLLLTLSGLKRELVQRLTDEGEGPIIDYRRDTPTTYEKDWDRGAERFKKVLKLDPGNKRAEADLSLCEGHLLRIRSRHVVNRKPEYDKDKQRDAIEHMEKAASLQPKSFDPYLGLARIYFYDIQDLDKGSEMLGRAAHLGHPVGKRDRVMQADALRARGVRSEETARSFAGTPHEKELLQSALEDFKNSVATYDALMDFNPSIPTLIKGCDRQIDDIQKRLTTLSSTPSSSATP
jgi:hypothetical protein